MPRLDDPSFFGRNGLKGVAEQLGMVEIDAGDDREQGILDDVGGVQSAAQTHLQHHKVHPASPEIFKPDSGDQLEFTRRSGQAVGLFPDKLRDFGQRLRRDRLTVHANALLKFPDERRCKKPCPVACRTQNRVRHGAKAAFAVGTGHMNAAVGVLRVAHRGQQRTDVIEVWVPRIVAQGVNIAQGFLMCHDSVLPHCK